MSPTTQGAAGMFQVWSCRAHQQRLSATGCPPKAVGTPSLDQITVAAVRSKMITICGQIGGSKHEVLLDSGSAVSL